MSRYNIIRNRTISPNGSIVDNDDELRPIGGYDRLFYGDSSNFFENKDLGELNPYQLNLEDPYKMEGADDYKEMSNDILKSTWAQTGDMYSTVSGIPDFMSGNNYPASNGTTSQTQAESNEEENKALDGNPMNPMSMPYFVPDMSGRAQMLGRSIGRIRGMSQMWGDAENNQQRALAGVSRGANIAQGVLAGVSLATGLGREIYGSAAAEKARQEQLMSYRDKLAKERKRSFVRYEDGGSMNLGDGRTFNTGSLTGEYIYPLPKSMEDSANVEIEKGEYATRPDVMAPMEALGSKHENGGTPVSLPDGSHIISDYRKITPELASRLRDEYGLRVTPKDSYAKVLDKYKNKSGLKEMYEDQEKIYKRLDKNEKVKDNNTSDLNKSILSKYISENQSKIDELEKDFRGFSEMIYKEQELSKRVEKMDGLFREGGLIDIKKVRSTAKAAGITEEDAKNILYDAYVSERRKMAVGGPTKEDEERALKQKEILNKLFGRNLNFSIIDVLGRDAILNKNSNVNANQDLQHRGVGDVYGRATRESVSNLLDVNRWANPLNANNELDVEGFQTGYNKQLNALWALANSGAISNYKDAKKFRDEYGFWGQQVQDYNNPQSAYNSFAVDDKYGQTTATRSFYGLDVVTPEQKKLLNEKGIKNYVDLFGDKAGDAKKILGTDYDKFQEMQKSGAFGDMDFILTSYEDKPDFPILGTPGAELDVEGRRPDLSPINRPMVYPTRDAQPQVQQEEAPVEEKAERGRARGPFFTGPMFPEIFREMPSGNIITEGLERHQAPRVDPVLQSADQYINELNRATSAQMDAIGDVPDSQRGAILAHLNSMAGSNIAKYIAQVNYANAQQINQADRFNEIAYTQTDDKNIAERQRYEASALKAMAISDENRARYWDSINDEIQKKFNVATSLNTIKSIAPDLQMLPSGQVIYSSDKKTLEPGNWSTSLLSAMTDYYSDDKKKKSSYRGIPTSVLEEIASRYYKK